MLLISSINSLTNYEVTINGKTSRQGNKGLLQSYLAVKVLGTNRSVVVLGRGDNNLLLLYIIIYTYVRDHGSQALLLIYDYYLY